MTPSPPSCKYCSTPGTGVYCSSCGEKLISSRISIGSIFHEVFHFFTHLDHGFPYTLKRLITAPGKMEKEYIEGHRSKYQKPFSMFFLCGTVAALAIYWINLLLLKHFGGGDSDEAIFFHKYWVLLQICMLPFYALITYLFFKSSKLNYGEVMVLELYVFSFLFILLTVIHLFKFPFPHLQTRYIELPLIILYTVITNIYFFSMMKKPVVAVLSVISISINFLLASGVQDFFVKVFS